MDENQKPIINAQAATAASAAQPNESDIKNLEEEFKKELGGGENMTGQVPKMPELEETRKKIENKASQLEEDVKNKLKELKDLRAKIEEELKEIKELKKTEAEIKDLEDKKGEIEKEIKVIEERTTSL